jgi:hypothetical protein
MVAIFRAGLGFTGTGLKEARRLYFRSRLA